MRVDGCVPLSSERHAQRFWRRFTSYDFARDLRHVPLVLAEVEAVAAAMPVVFASDAEGVGPVALLRLVPGGKTPFVSPAGLWLATYVPSILRVHPFSARPAGGGRMMLMVDEDSGLVTDSPGDEPFFDASGAPSPPVAELVEFFRQREASARRSRAAAEGLAALGLLAPFRPEGAEAPPDSWDGLQVIDRARFDAVEDSAHLELRRLGAVALAHAHFVSMAQVPWLLRAEAARDAEAAGLRRAPEVAPPATGPGDAGLEDFFAALAADRDGSDGATEAEAQSDRPPPTRGGRTH